MKRILILLIGLFIMSGAFAQEFEFDINDYANSEGVIDFEAAMADIEDNDASSAEILPALLEGDTIDYIDFSSVMPGDEGEVFDDAAIADLTAILVESGIEDLTLIEDSLKIAEALKSGMTIAQIKADTELSLIYESAEEGMITLVAEQAKDSIITPELEEQLGTALSIVGFAVNTLKGFAQSTANTSNAGNMFGYQGYKLLTVSLGTFGSFAIPEPLDTANMTMDTLNNLNKDQDPLEEIQTLFDAEGIEAGITGQGMVLSLGLNFSWLIDNLYLGVVIGSTGISISKDAGLDVLVMDSSVYNMPTDDLGIEALDEIPAFDISIGSSIYGIRANYQLLKGFGIPILFRWNGLSLGTGLIVNTMHFDAKMDLSSMLELDPKSFGIEFGIDSTTFTIPLEASTGIQLLSVVTITAGAGVDVQFGSSETYLNLKTADSESLASKVINKTINSIVSAEGLNFPISNEGTPEFINPRINAGLGIGLGPVVFDFSAYYYLRTGVAFGASVLIRL